MMNGAAEDIEFWFFNLPKHVHFGLIQIHVYVKHPYQLRALTGIRQNCKHQLPHREFQFGLFYTRNRKNESKSGLKSCSLE